MTHQWLLAFGVRTVPPKFSSRKRKVMETKPWDVASVATSENKWQLQASCFLMTYPGHIPRGGSGCTAGGIAKESARAFPGKDPWYWAVREDAVMFFKQEQPQRSRKHAFTRKNTCAHMSTYVYFFYPRSTGTVCYQSFSWSGWKDTLRSFSVAGLGILLRLEIKGPCRCVQVLMRSKLGRF